MIHPRTEFKFISIACNDLFQRSFGQSDQVVTSWMYSILNWPKECAVYISKSKHNSSQMVIKFPRVNTDEFDSRLLSVFLRSLKAIWKIFKHRQEALSNVIQVWNESKSGIKRRIGHVLSVCLEPFRFEDPWSKWNWYWLDFWYHCR